MRTHFLAAVTAAIAFLGSTKAQAQHEGHPAQRDTSTGMDSTMRMPAMPERPFGIPMTRMGSGTAWLPDASAMRAWHFMAGAWRAGPAVPTSWAASTGGCSWLCAGWKAAPCISTA
jgi:hypothetical protein